MANNPFYKGSTTINAQEKKFDENKAVIVSRLVQTGMDQEDAESLVGESSNEEDLILKLMQQQDMTYGDASEASHVED